MAYSKGLKEFLDFEGDGKTAKTTKRNKYKVLRYYGYGIDDIQVILDIGVMTPYKKINLRNMMMRGKPTKVMLFTKEEREMFSEDEIIRSDKIIQGVRNEEEPLDDEVEVETTREDVLKHIKESINKSLGKEDVKKEDARNLKTKKVTSEYKGGICPKCQGKGWVTVKRGGSFKTETCPVCLGNSIKQEKSIDTNRLDMYNINNLIPNKEYHNKYFSTDKVNHTHPKLRQDARMSRVLDNYTMFIEGVLSESRRGVVPNKSYYIVAPDGFGKKIFIYDFIQNLLSMNIVTTPILDYYDLIDVLFGDNVTGEGVHNVLNRDVIIITVSNISKKKYLVSLLKYVLDYGERYGKPVVVIGRALPNLIVDMNLEGQTLFSKKTDVGDFGHLEIHGFLGADYYEAVKSQSERMAGTFMKIEG